MANMVVPVRLGRITTVFVIDSFVAVLELSVACECHPTYTDGVYNPETKLESQRDLTELVLRDRNHPSVWVWNLCNGKCSCSASQGT